MNKLVGKERYAAVLDRDATRELFAKPELEPHKSEMRLQRVFIEMLVQACVPREEATRLGKLAWDIHQSLTGNDLPEPHLHGFEEEEIGQEASMRSNEIPQLIIVAPANK